VKRFMLTVIMTLLMAGILMILILAAVNLAG
jgi:hypothetical protein